MGIMFFVVLGWAAKNLIYLTLNCIQSEKFYIMVEKTEETCLQLMKNPNCSKNQKRLCRVVLQANRSFSKISACGLFYVDATLPILFTEVLTGNIIVLLQFAFL
ncbi:hypothetical protein HW555_010370 [Spodoptera exigua]|uniref:Uncharacterized protein n=1 Tax=Spodoptera exigua TaxID=7107 RepID=A0A835L1M4_SPOEX|nr:hypothetical protein HW555_010370 [Spodoptera exigua]